MSSMEIQGQLWGMASRDWANLQESRMANVWGEMLELLTVRRGTTLADLGCGAGGASRLAAERGASVYGLDASPPMIEIAREIVPDGEFRVGDLEDLPYSDGAFDAVLAANSIQFAGDPRHALGEVQRVCRPDGRVAVAVWGLPENCDARAMFEAVIGVLPERPPGGGPFALSMPGVLDEMFDQAGLRKTGEQVVPSAMSYQDMPTAWRAMRSAGPLQGAIRAVGEEPVHDAVVDALSQFQGPDGRIELKNEFKVVTARV